MLNHLSINSLEKEFLKSRQIRLCENSWVPDAGMSQGLKAACPHAASPNLRQSASRRVRLPAYNCSLVSREKVSLVTSSPTGRLISCSTLATRLFWQRVFLRKTKIVVTI